MVKATKCQSNVGKRKCKRSPNKNTSCCHSHTAAKFKPLVNVLVDENVGTNRRYCRRCHQSTHIDVLTETNMCVACVYTLERFIKDFHKEQLRKKKEDSEKGSA